MPATPAATARFAAAWTRRTRGVARHAPAVCEHLDVRSGTGTCRRFRTGLRGTGTRTDLPDLALRLRTCRIRGWDTACARTLRSLDVRSGSGTRRGVCGSVRGTRAGVRPTPSPLRHRSGDRIASGFDARPAARVRTMDAQPGTRTRRRIRAGCCRTDTGAGCVRATHGCRTGARVATKCEPGGMRPLDAGVALAAARQLVGQRCRIGVRAEPATDRRFAADARAGIHRGPRISSRHSKICSNHRRCACNGCPHPAPDPVFSHLQSSVAPAVIAPVVPKAPRLGHVRRRHVCAVDLPSRTICRSRNRSWTPCGRLRRTRRWL